MELVRLIPQAFILHLLRHAETEANVRNATADGGQVGGVQTNLTPYGEEQCLLLGDYIRDTKTPIDVAGSSDMLRTQRTKEAVLRHFGKELIVLPDSPKLREISYGSWEGRPLAETHNAYSRARMAFLSMDHAALGGESMSQVAGRVLEWILEAAPHLPVRVDREPVLLAITHGVTIKSVAQRFTHADHTAAWKARIDNTSITSFRYDPEAAGNAWSLIRFNASPHLRCSL